MPSASKPQPTANTRDPFPETSLRDSAVEDLLIKARITMLLKSNASFFGKLACSLNFINASKWCPTAATDGRNFYYNKDFIAALHDRDPGQVVFLIGHEVLHCVYDHMGRRGERDPRLWNIANDFRVNGDLVESRIGNFIDLVEILHDTKYRNHTSEEIYDELFQEAEEEGRVVYIDTLDEHLEPQRDGDPSSGAGSGEGDDNNDGSQGPIKYSQDELDDIKATFQSQVEQAARGESAGDLPGGVKRLIDSLLAPQLDWRELITMRIKSLIKSDYSFQTFSRKGLDQGIYMPGMNPDETIDVVIACDTSGSMSNEMLLDILSEVKGCMDQYTNFKIKLFCFDTKVLNPQEFTDQNMDEFLDYEPQGGGGTDFDVCWQYMKDNSVDPNLFVMFTDGYPWDSWGDENYCDTLFIVHGGRNGNVPQAPFGTTVPYTTA